MLMLIVNFEELVALFECVFAQDLLDPLKVFFAKVHPDYQHVRDCVATPFNEDKVLATCYLKIHVNI